MFSGKSTLLINSSKKTNNNLIINNMFDSKRTNKNKLITHDKQSIDCFMLKNLKQIFKLKEYNNCKNIYIDEIQFFDNIIEIIIKMVEIDNKNVICAGLDGTFERKMFNTLKLIPYCDELIKLTSICSICKNKAYFSKRIVNCKDKILVGSSDSYIPVCRKHFT